MNLHRSAALLTLPAVVLVACTRSATDGGGTASPGFANTVQPIFTASCATGFCHVGDNPSAGMNLSAGVAYASIVNVPANELVTMSRIRPGQPDSSYLVHKIQGTHLSVGGIRARMPVGGPYLSDQEVARIRDWVSQGAAND